MIWCLSFFFLTSLSRISSRSIHVAANGIISFLWNNGIISLFHMAVYMYHIFFIHLSINGHLGWFHVLAIVNSTAVNIGVHLSFHITVLSGYMPRSGLLDNVVTLFLVFWWTSLLFSIVTAPIYIPTKSVRGFTFLHSLSSIYYFVGLLIMAILTDVR